jgi:hypothetical protein
VTRPPNPALSLLAVLCAVVALSLPAPSEASRHGTGGGQPSKSHAGPSASSKAGPSGGHRPAHRRDALIVHPNQAQAIANAALAAKRKGVLGSPHAGPIDTKGKGPRAGATSGQGASAVKQRKHRAHSGNPSRHQGAKNQGLQADRIAKGRVATPGPRKKTTKNARSGKAFTLTAQPSTSPRPPGTSAAGPSSQRQGDMWPTRAPPAASKKSRTRKSGKTDTFSSVQSDRSPSVFLERAPLRGSNE